jgi:hypothetical protein
MRTLDILTVLGLAISHTTAQISTEGIKLPLPTRELEWKDVNFISISDSHGEPLTYSLSLQILIARMALGASACKLSSPPDENEADMNRRLGLNLYDLDILYPRT